MLRRMLLTTIVSVALTLVLFGFANATTYYVKVGGTGTTGHSYGDAFGKIQDAIDMCGTETPPDLILVYDGVYNADTYPIVFNNKSDITLEYVGANKLNGPVIKGDGAHRVIEILYSQRITIRGFKITNGFVYGDGGGIYVDHSDDVLLENLEVTDNSCQGENTTYTGNGGGIACDYSTVDIIDSCIWENGSYVDGYVNGGNGGGIALFNPDQGAADRGYFIRDCCIFWNLSEKAGGGIYFSGDDGYSVVENNLIRQNRACQENSGAGIHSQCAKVYVRDNTVADNYHCEDQMPTWGYPDPTVPVYGIYACTQSGFWMKGVHNIVYFNGPSGVDDWNICPATIKVYYSDVSMVTQSPYPDPDHSPTNTNMDRDPDFTGRIDEDRPCNSEFYFLDYDSPCIDKGIPQAAEPWETGEDHCDLVNTDSGKNPRYSVHRDGSEDKDEYCDNGPCGTRIDLGYHFNWHGMNYVELDSFTVEAFGNKAVLNWETATEMNNAGFLVYRCDGVASDCSKISDLIVANGDASLGATYSFTDTNVAPGASYYYYLVDIDLSGEWTAHGPVFVRIPLVLDSIRMLPKLESVIR